MLTLSGIGVVILGFALRFNPLLVVTAAALVTGFAAGLDFVAIVSAFGKAFNQNRYVSLVWLLLPVIGSLEHAGLQERARSWIAGLRTATSGRLLALYLLLRQLSSAMGLTSLGGHPQMVRPLMAPMTEAAFEARHGAPGPQLRARIRAMVAATDNIGLFFGEDIFIAIGSILLMKGFLEQSGILVEPLHLSLWAIPTAIAALIVQGTRVLLLDRIWAAQHRQTRP
jgi:uncharacterized membrane protein